MSETKEDNFKDPTSVFGNMTAKFSIEDIRNWSKREYIMGGIMAALFLLFLIFAGLLGHAYSRPMATANNCVTPQCLDSAAYVSDNMNRTIDPCTNFYQFACGSYKNTRPIRADRTSRTTLSDLYHKNQQRLLDLMIAPYSRTTEWSSERKLKDLYRSCIDDYSTERARGTPFINKIIRAMMGGWYVLDGNVPTNFELNSALKIVQTDLWTGAFWANYVGFDWLDMSKLVVQLFPVGSGQYMQWSYYLREDTAQFRLDYKKFMTRIAKLIIRDANAANVPDSRVQQFVDDAFGLETKLARLYNASGWVSNRFSDANKISLDDLTSQSGNVIDWTAQMTYEYSSLTGSSKVVLFKRDFMFGLSTLINNLPNGDRNRILHNFLMWRLLEKYAQDLSWEYVHANREYYVDMSGQISFSGTQKYCFWFASQVMQDAMGALFVRDHFTDKNKDKAVEITNYLKQAMLDELDSNNWMDGPTKKVAVQKMKKMVYKIGYPDFIIDQDTLDKRYISLKINISDHFQNVLNINNFQKVYYEEMLEGGVDRTKWAYRLFDTAAGILFYWNEIILPAGMLQSPIYDYHTPHYMSFGSLGTIVGQFITHIIDRRGSYFTAEGKYNRDTWWTNGTKVAYDHVKQCVVDYYTNKTQGPFIKPDGQKEYIPIQATRYVSDAIAITTGVKLAYKAYKKWVSDHSVEKTMPGISLTNDQMFFVTHAQTWCYNRNNNEAFTNAIRGKVEEDMRTNLALSQLPEFQQAFNCKAGSKMNAPSKCGYY